MRITKVDIDVGRQFQAGVISKLLAAIPGEGSVELTWQPLGLFDQRRDDAFGILVGNLDQHDIPGMALDQRRDIAVLRPADQVTGV